MTDWWAALADQPINHTTKVVRTKDSEKASIMLLERKVLNSRSVTPKNFLFIRAIRELRMTWEASSRLSTNKKLNNGINQIKNYTLDSMSLLLEETLPMGRTRPMKMALVRKVLVGGGHPSEV